MQLLANSFAKRGYGIVSDREYHSNIKGKHSYITLRASAISIPKTLRETVQIIGAMDSETVFTHFDELEEGGYLIYDSSQIDKSVHAIPSMPPQVKKRIIKRFEDLGVEETLSSLITYLTANRRVVAVELDFSRILASLNTRFPLIPQQASRYVSSILFGALAGLVDIDDDCVRYCIKNRFADKEKVVEQNLFIVKDVSNLTKATYGVPYKLKPSHNHQKAFILGKGNDVVAMGKIIGGLRYQSYYPITPAADESFFIEAHNHLHNDGKDGSILVLQTEDELAAITSAIGAALTGTRSATATSGPGFSLMVEGLGWAGINEVPVVITYYQRSGPSTGQATRGSQADLLSVLFASHGEFPRLVIASGDHEEAFYDAIEAFNLAERYQVPVIHLLDKFLANSIVTMPLPNLSKVKIERGELVEKPCEGYKRFDLTKTMSPRARLGSNTVIGYTGSEHDEWGCSNEDPVNRKAMTEKRMTKFELADSEIPAERRVVYYGPEEANVLLVGWGYVKMVALEALTELNKAEYMGAYLHLKMFSPFPSRYVTSIMNRFTPDRVIALEYNYQAQAVMAVKLYSGKEITRSIVKYTGRPMYLNEVVEAIKTILETDVRRVVLNHGS